MTKKIAYLSFDHDDVDGWYHLLEPEGLKGIWGASGDLCHYAQQQGWECHWRGGYTHYKPEGMMLEVIST